MLNQYREKTVRTAGRNESFPMISSFGTPENVFCYFWIWKQLKIDAAVLAAQNATDEDIANLDEHIVLMRYTVGSYHLWGKSAHQFHRSITETTHNALYIHLIAAIHNLFRCTVHSSLKRSLKNKKRMQHDIVDQHEAIAAAIGNHDAPAAGEMVRLHMDYIEDV